MIEINPTYIERPDNKRFPHQILIDARYKPNPEPIDFFTMTTNRSVYKEFKDVKDEVAEFLVTSYGKGGRRWMLSKFNSRMVVFFADKTDATVFMLRFR